MHTGQQTKTDFKQNLIFTTHITISLVLHSSENFSIFLSTLQPYTVSLPAYLWVELNSQLQLLLCSLQCPVLRLSMFTIVYAVSTITFFTPYMSDPKPVKISRRAVIGFSGLSSSRASLSCHYGFFTKLCKHCCYYYKEIPWKQSREISVIKFYKTLFYQLVLSILNQKNCIHSEDLPVYQTGK